ncbi:MAG: hypothetical protein P8N52_00655 [Crocinitomicaceae bacterium]|nr:hypothetical protein [Crocinitomicaceae bacterium]MDG1777096.1 hypothetical protein [Crocinitomicaceae bacterium]
MKKSILIIVLGSIVLISCKKKRTCQCEIHTFNGPVITHTVLEGTLSDTKVECDAIKVNLQVGTSDYVECGIQ